jgi:hypothetical protein
MKDTYYFQHDYEPTADPKIQALLHKFGGLGYGLWWRIIEMLHSDELHKLQRKKFIILAIAGQMSTSVEIVNQFIDFCVNDVELLFADEEFLWSDRVNRNIDKRLKLSHKRSLAGKKSAELRNTCSTHDEHMLNTCSTKLNKEKKRKENNNIIPELSDFMDYAKTIEIYKSNLNYAIKSKYEAWKDNGWKDGYEKEIKNWKTTLRNTMPHLKPIENNSQKNIIW